MGKTGLGSVFLALGFLALGALGVGPAAATGVVEIDHPESFSRVLALSDPHGMYDALVRLLQASDVIDGQKNWAGGKTLLVVVGDSIDKGPQSLEVIDLWMSLMPQAASAGGRVVVLLGNHEAEFLADPSNDQKAAELLAELRAKGVSPQELTDPSRPRGAFLRSLPVAARLGRWLFAHAGFLPDGGWSDFVARSAETISAGRYADLTGDTSILEAKGWWGKPKQRQALEARLDSAGLSGVIFGHQPKALGVEGASAISDDGRLIKIDNGMAPEAGSHAGSVLVIASPDELLGDASQLRVSAILPTGEVTGLLPENKKAPPESLDRD